MSQGQVLPVSLRVVSRPVPVRPGGVVVPVSHRSRVRGEWPVWPLVGLALLVAGILIGLFIAVSLTPVGGLR